MTTPMLYLDSMEKIYTLRETIISDKAWGYLVLENPNFIWSYYKEE